MVLVMSKGSAKEAVDDPILTGGYFRASILGYTKH